MNFSKLKNILGVVGKGIKAGDEVLAIPGLTYKDGSSLTPIKLLDGSMAAARTAISEAQDGNFKDAIPKALESFEENPENAPDWSNIVEKAGMDRDKSDLLGGAISMIEPSIGGKLKVASKLDKVNDLTKVAKFGKIINVIDGVPQVVNKVSMKPGQMMREFNAAVLKKTK